MSDDLNAVLNARIDTALRARSDEGAAWSPEAEFDARVAQARRLAQDLGVDAAEVTRAIAPSPTSAIKRRLHELVIYYVNRLAGRVEASQRQQLEALAALREIVARQQAEIDALRSGSVEPRA